MKSKGLPLVYRLGVLFLLLVVVVLVFRVFIGRENEQVLSMVELAADAEFIDHPEGLAAFEDMYGFRFDNSHAMVVGLTHEALRIGDVDVAMGFTTDGKILELDLVSLTDDKGFFPVYHVAPVVRSEILTHYPSIAELLSEIGSRLDTETMIHLNYQAEIGGHEVTEVARTWLQDEGLLSSPPTVIDGEYPVRVGSNALAEQKVLGAIALLAIEGLGIMVEDHIQPLVPALGREQILAGAIDIYFESSSTEWYQSFRDETIQADSHEDAYAEASARDAQEGLIWLKPASYAISRSILMRKEHAQELGITTISDLAAWVDEM